MSIRRVTIVALMMLIGAACSSSTPTGGSSQPDAPSEPTSDASATYLELARRGLNADDFKVTYQVKSDGESQEMSWAKRGDDSSFTIGSGDDRILIIAKADGTTIACSDGSCFQFDNPDAAAGLAGAFAPFQAFTNALTEADSLPGFTTRGSTTIAGQSATCASWSYLGSSAEVCVLDDSGLLGSLKITASGTDGGGFLEWELTALGDATDADFEPTGEVESFG